MIGHIAARELRSLFLSPLAWAILAVVMLISGILFSAFLQIYVERQAFAAMGPNPLGATDQVIAPTFFWASFLMTFVVPLLTMRMISEERRAGTLTLLFSAPISITEIIVGKYLGLLGFVGIMLALTLLMPAALMFAGHLDLGVVASSALGLALILAAFGALGLYLSALTSQPVVAAVSAFGVLFVLWILDIVALANTDAEGGVFTYLSLQRHYQPLLRGVFDTSDLIYYALFILTFIVLSIRRLDADRLQH